MQRTQVKAKRLLLQISRRGMDGKVKTAQLAEQKRWRAGERLPFLTSNFIDNNPPTLPSTKGRPYGRDIGPA